MGAFFMAKRPNQPTKRLRKTAQNRPNTLWKKTKRIHLLALKVFHPL